LIEFFYTKLKEPTLAAYTWGALTPSNRGAEDTQWRAPKTE